MTSEPTKRRGRWLPGQSGNPNGRPRGVGVAGRVREQMGERLAEVVETLLARALAGDVHAARVVLDRVVAPLRPTEQGVPITMPINATITQQAQAVLSAAAGAEIGPASAAALLAALAQVARVRELDELAARVAALEGKNDGQ